MSWTWERLRSTLHSLDLPDDRYVVGLAGAMLANESVDSVDEVVLLVTDPLYSGLVREGWPAYDGLAGLRCPGEPGLYARADDVSDTYTAPVAELVAGSWRQDGIPMVSVLQIDRTAVQQFLARVSIDEQPEPVEMAWTWERLRDAVKDLALPEGEYVVGLAGALLANESLPRIDEIELLVTERLRGELVSQDWLPDDTGTALLCPSHDDLLARSGEVPGPYRASITDLVAEAWTQDGLPLVSMVQVDGEAVRTFIASRRGPSE